MNRTTIAVDPKTREKRQTTSAEIFTPDALVNKMLDLLPKSVWKPGKTFCDPAAGNGNFLVHVLIRKIQKGQDPLDAICTVYGVDIMPDNVQECRARLLKVVSIFDDVSKDHIEAVLRNIVCADSLTYDFEFDGKPTKREVQRWFDGIYDDNVLDDVSLPGIAA